MELYLFAEINVIFVENYAGIIDTSLASLVYFNEVMWYFVHKLFVEIRVRFLQTQYTGSEAAGFVMVTLQLVGGVSSNPFNVTVIPSEQSPVSAEGNSVMCMIMCWVKSVWLTGGVDFNTTLLIATFDSGMTMSSVSVPVIADNIFEGYETFNVILSIPSSVNRRIIANGQVNATVTITDSTSKFITVC